MPPTLSITSVKEHPLITDGEEIGALPHRPS